MKEGYIDDKIFSMVLPKKQILNYMDGNKNHTVKICSTVIYLCIKLVQLSLIVCITALKKFHYTSITRPVIHFLFS